MIAALRRLRNATWAQHKLFVEAVAALAAARFLFAVLPFAKAAALVRTPHRQAPADSERQALVSSVRRSILTVAPHLPWRAMCLEQGFAAHWMLRRRAIPTVLHYGIRMERGELQAHVWVRSDDADIIGCENRSEFAEVAQFPNKSGRS